MPYIDSWNPNRNSENTNTNCEIPNMDSGIPNIDSRPPNMDFENANRTSLIPNKEHDSENTHTNGENLYMDSENTNMDSENINFWNREHGLGTPNILKKHGFWNTEHGSGILNRDCETPDMDSGFPNIDSELNYSEHGLTNPELGFWNNGTWIPEYRISMLEPEVNYGTSNMDSESRKFDLENMNIFLKIP